MEQEQYYTNKELSEKWGITLKKEKQYYTTKELAERWSISPKTLAYWREKGTGIRYSILGVNKRGRGRSCVRYHIEDILSFEKEASVEVA